MAELPQVDGRTVIDALGRAGFEVVRIKGSHHIMKSPAVRALITVPVHGARPVKKGTLRSIIRDAGLTVEQFVSLCD